ncbi:MAG: carboxypeptidase-like regulatory domain-containing protein, partial [Pseudonocardiaceae bacterium]
DVATALTGGFTRAFGVAGVICVAAAAAALILPRQARRRPEPSPVPVPAPESALPAPSAPGDTNRLITGRVLDDDRRPVRGAAVTVVDMAGRQVGLARSGHDGTFRTTTPGTGSYLVVTSADQHHPAAEVISVNGDAMRYEPVLRTR